MDIKDRESRDITVQFFEYYDLHTPHISASFMNFEKVAK